MIKRVEAMKKYINFKIISVFSENSDENVIIFKNNKWHIKFLNLHIFNKIILRAFRKLSEFLGWFIKVTTVL